MKREALGAGQSSDRRGERPGRAHAVRCRVQARADGLHATPTGPQGSHILTSMLGADALAIIPSERAEVCRGERVRPVD